MAMSKPPKPWISVVPNATRQTLNNEGYRRERELVSAGESVIFVKSVGFLTHSIYATGYNIRTVKILFWLPCPAMNRESAWTRNFAKLTRGFVSRIFATC